MRTGMVLFRAQGLVMLCHVVFISVNIFGWMRCLGTIGLFLSKCDGHVTLSISYLQACTGHVIVRDPKALLLTVTIEFIKF